MTDTVDRISTMMYCNKCEGVSPCIVVNCGNTTMPHCTPEWKLVQYMPAEAKAALRQALNIIIDDAEGVK